MDTATASEDAAAAAAAVEAGAPFHAATPRDARRSLMHTRRAAAWRHLNTVERDVLLVITALCKV